MNNLKSRLTDYHTLINLEPKEYPKYLAEIFKLKTGENINLTPLCYFPLRWGGLGRGFGRNTQTFNQKIQWLKLYDVSPLKKLCTDKVTVRDYVKEKISAEYLKPALQIITKDKFYINYRLIESLRGISRSNTDETFSSLSGLPRSFHSLAMTECCHNDTMQSFNYPIECESLFDKIDFDSLPSSFVMKCSHGCKWQYIIKNKEEYLNNKSMFYLTRSQMTGWLEQEFWAFGGFEMQYKGLEPKIIIEPLMRDDINRLCPEIMIYCFKGVPKFAVKQHNEEEITIYDENLKISEEIIDFSEKRMNKEADENVKLAFELSKELSKDFIFVRADWMLYKNKLYFEELTFTPFSGFLNFKNKEKNIKLGKLIELPDIPRWK